MMHSLSCGVAALAVVVGLARPGLAWLDPADPSVHVVLDTEDTQFSYSSPDAQSRWLLSYGKSTTSRIRGWQDLTALRFDLSAFRGRTVEQAELHLAKADSEPTFALVASTINTDWHEGNATGGNAGVGDPCWRWRSMPANPAAPAPGDDWTFHHGDVSTVTFGNYGTLVCYAYGTDGTFGAYTAGSQSWIRMRLDPAQVQALILDQYGLVVTDSRLSTYTNYFPAIYTKEAGSATQPRLYVRFADALDRTAPQPVDALTAEAGPENGEVVLHFAAPADPQAPTAFGYTVRYSTGGDFDSATDVARWRIPRPKAPGKAQRVLIEDLSPGTAYTFFVQAYDAAGNGSDIRSVIFTLPAARPTPVLADGPFVAPDPAGRTVPSAGGVLRYWAGSEVVKINPLTGNRMEDGYTGSGADDYKKANVVWDAGANAISLTACRNEVVGAQLFIERLGSALTNVRVTAGDLCGPQGAGIPASPCVEFFQLHYVSSSGIRYADAAIPLAPPFATTFNVPDTIRNPAGKNQAVWMDLYVPKGTPAGDYSGTITIAAAELAQPVTVSLRLSVAPLTIPDEPTFLVDLNGYGNPWDFGNTQLTCLRYFQACHKHRAMCNTLPYGWSANVRADRCPTLTGAGPTLHAADWTAHDTKYGRFFDGSAFSPDDPASPYTGPGIDTPVTHLYTTFFESWPIHILDATYGFDPTNPPLPGMPGLGGTYWNNLNNTNYTQFFLTVPDIYPAFPDGYKQGVRNVIADWFTHAQQKGWTRTNFQIYLNHKYYYDGCAVLWELEEVESADDFRAVGYFHTLYRDGQTIANVPDVRWHFRIDISDRWSQNWGRIDNLINLHMMNHRSASWCWRQMEYRNYHLDADRQEEWMWYNLGAAITGQGIGQSRLFLQKWSQGYLGGLPYWDNYQTSWTTPNDLSNVYSGQSVPGFGLYEGPIMGIRVKMMRQAQQVVELLNQWAGLSGFNRPLIRDALNAKYGDHTWDYAFTNVDEVKLYRLRSDLMAQLESLTAILGDVDGSGRVDIIDLLRVVNAFGKTTGQPGYDSRADIDRSGIVNILDLITVVNRFGQAS